VQKFICRNLFSHVTFICHKFFSMIEFQFDLTTYDRQFSSKLRRNSLFRVLRKVCKRTQSMSLAVSTNFVTNYVSFELSGTTAVRTAGTGTISIPLKATFRFCSHEWNEKPQRVTFWRITGCNKNMVYSMFRKVRTAFHDDYPLTNPKLIFSLLKYIGISVNEESKI